jgi:hypothetical protein
MAPGCDLCMCCAICAGGVAICACGVRSVHVVCDLCRWGAICAGGVRSVHVVCDLCMWCAICAGEVRSVQVGCDLCMWCAICACGVRNVQVGCDLCRWGAICACGVPHCSQMAASRPKEILFSERFCETKLSGCRGDVKTERNYMNALITNGLQG